MQTTSYFPTVRTFDESVTINANKLGKIFIKYIHTEFPKISSSISHSVNKQKGKYTIRMTAMMFYILHEI